MSVYQGNGDGAANGVPYLASAGAREFRQPPQNLEAEQGVIGSVLLDEGVMDEVARVLPGAEYFFRDDHATAYRALLDLYREGKPLDAVSVAEELERRGEFRRVGGDETLARAIGSVPHAANAAYYAGIVREKAIGRGLIAAHAEGLEDAYSNAFTADELLDRAGRRVLALAEDRPGQSVARAADVLPDVMDRIARRRGGEVSGMTTGFEELDVLTGGLQPEQLVVLAARPSMGKTAWALNLCEHVACTLERPVLFFSLEMNAAALLERMVCARAWVDAHKVRGGYPLRPDDLDALERARASLAAAPLAFDDSPAQGMLRVVATARGRRMRGGVGLVVLDYLQLVDPDDPRASRNEQVAAMSRQCKGLARELKAPVVVLSQLNRGVESREDKRPRMSDLRDSGAVEQDADLVLLLYRPEYYDPNDQPGTAELILAKNRSGPTGTVKLVFRKSLMRFGEVPAPAPLDASVGVYYPPSDDF